jgi:hypothetical protein
VAPEQTQVNSDYMDDALDYVIGLSQDSSSGYYNKVDTSKLGATGYPRIEPALLWRAVANPRRGKPTQATSLFTPSGACRVAPREGAGDPEAFRWAMVTRRTTRTISA